MHTPLTQPRFLPMTRAECDALGWSPLDIILVTGDAYADHPAFGAAIIGRALVAQGLRVGIIAQPDWRQNADFQQLGAPRLFFGVTAGNLDSIVAHYTPQRKIRTEDAYSPDGVAGRRPDRACLVYAQCLQRAFAPRIPIVLGGIEASMRRIPHYDYYADTIRNSILFDAKADLLVYGMGEHAVTAIARALADGTPVAQLTNIPGTVVAVRAPDDTPHVLLPPLDEVRTPDGFFRMTRLFQNHFQTTPLYQAFAGRYLKHNPPAPALSTSALDALYDLPFARAPHPHYRGAPIPAFEQIKDSITAHRGCFGGCAFCALGFHQGKTIQSRSAASIVREVTRVAGQKSFRGTISDVGGPTANMYGMYCRRGISATCRRGSCIFPRICPQLEHGHAPVRALLRQCRAVPGVQHVAVASGVRFDLAAHDAEYVRALAMYYTGGRLKVAPEHVCEQTLQLMHKPLILAFEQFAAMFHAQRADAQIVPYLIVGHPGTTLRDAVELALYLKRHDLQVEQLQEFTPTPMTLSTCMYVTGRSFPAGTPIHVPKGRAIRLQKALAQWFMPENYKYVIEALRAANMPQAASELRDALQQITPPRHQDTKKK